MEQATETTTATAVIYEMKTVAVLLEKGLLERVDGVQVSETRVNFNVTYRVEDEEKVQDLMRRCKGGMYGIMVDAGEYQDAFRKVSRLVDGVLQR